MMTDDTVTAPVPGEGAPAVLPATVGAPPALRDPAYERMDVMYRLAQRTTNTEMIPKALRGRPDAALAVMVYGHEIGLAPMTALREVFIIDGTPSCSAKLMRALIFRAGHVLRFEDVSTERVVVYGERNDGQGSARVTWTLDDAKRAGLLTKDVWKKYPSDMLVARATSRIARLIFADATIGYTPEELSRVNLRAAYQDDPLRVGSTSSAATLDYIDVGDDPPTDDWENVDERPAHEVAAEILDAEDAMDAELLRQAADDVDAQWIAEAKGEHDAD